MSGILEQIEQLANDEVGGIIETDKLIQLAADFKIAVAFINEVRAFTAGRLSQNFELINDKANEALAKIKTRGEGEEKTIQKVEPFNDLRSNDKWDQWKAQKGSFICPNCENKSKPERCSPFPGTTIHCGICDQELSRRTGGGQNDPFGWILTADTEGGKGS